MVEGPGEGVRRYLGGDLHVDVQHGAVVALLGARDAPDLGEAGQQDGLWRQAWRTAHHTTRWSRATGEEKFRGGVRNVLEV